MDPRQRSPTPPPALPPSSGAPLMPLLLPPLPLPSGGGGPPFAPSSLPPHIMPPPPPPTPGSELSPSVLLDEEAFWAVHEMVLADEANKHGGPPGQQQQHHHHYSQPPGGYDTFLVDPETGELQFQVQAHDHSEAEGNSNNDSHSDSEDDNSDGGQGEGRRGGSSFDSGTAPPPFHLPPSILGNHLARLRPANGWEAGKGGGPTTRSGGRGRNGATGMRRGGRGGGAGGGRGLDGDQLTRRLRQKAESYERKKSRAKVGRKVLKERFETLLKACGDTRIRRSDKVGLLSRAIDLITGLRKELVALKGAGGPMLLLPPLGLDDARGDGHLGFVNLPSPPSTRGAKKRTAAGRRSRHQQQHHSAAAAAAEGSPFLARGGGGKKGAAVALDSRMWVEVPLVPLDALAQCFAAAPKAAFEVLDCLDPRSLATGRAVARAWRDWHSQELPWRELCRRRWRLALDDGPALEELRAALPLPPALATWRQVYAFHHRAALPPRGPVTSTLLGPNAHRLLLAHASANGVAAWLFLGATPAGPTPALLPFRLLLQNLAHDTALIPYQRLRLVSTGAAAASCSMDVVDEAPPRARTISNTSVGTSLAVASSGSEGEGEEDVDVDAFFLDHEEKGEKAPPLVSQQPKQAAATAAVKAGAGPCVVARNERRLDGAARIPWRRFNGTEGGPLRLGLFDTAVLALPLPLPAGCSTDTPLPSALLASAAEMAITVLSPAPQREDGDQMQVAAFVEARLALTLGPQQHMI